MNPLSLIPSWVWAAAVAALTTISCKLTVDLGAVKLELEKTKVVYEQERANAMTVLANAQERARQAEQSIQTTANAIREETHAQVLVARADADALRQRLRIAQANAATAALVSSATSSAGIAAAPVEAGAFLPAGVGDDLVSLALRAEELRADAQSCRRQYDAARAEIEAMSAQKSPQTPAKPAP